MNSVALHFDISKMYHSVKTTDKDKFMRLMAWENEEGNVKFFGPKVVMFGDQPASAILEGCKDLATDNGRKIDKEAATCIEEDSYIDGCTGSEEENVRRMMGECTIKEDGELEYNGTLSQILLAAGF